MALVRCSCACPLRRLVLTVWPDWKGSFGPGRGWVFIRCGIWRRQHFSVKFLHRMALLACKCAFQMGSGRGVWNFPLNVPHENVFRLRRLAQNGCCGPGGMSPAQAWEISYRNLAKGFRIEFLYRDRARTPLMEILYGDIAYHRSLLQRVCREVSYINLAKKAL